MFSRIVSGNTTVSWLIIPISRRRLGRLAAARDAYTRFLAIRPEDAAMVRRRLAEVESALEETQRQEERP